MKKRLNELIDKLMDEDTNLDKIAEKKGRKGPITQTMHSGGFKRLSWFGIDSSLSRKFERFFF